MSVFEKQDSWVEKKSPHICFCWFASYRTLIKFLLNSKKKRVVVAGGYDVSDIKGYGLLSSWKTSWIPKLIFRMADKIIASSELIENELMSIGVPKEKISVIYPAVDDIFFNSEHVKKDCFYDYITVANVNKRSFKVKGIDLLIKHAENHKNKSYLLVGNINVKGVKFPKNISATGFVRKENMIEKYLLSKKYLCPSRRESFGLAPIEAKIVGLDIEFLNDIYTKEFLKRNENLDILREKNRVDAITKIIGG